MTVTESAKKKVAVTLKGGGYLRVSVEGGGCSGFRIALEKESELPPDAHMITEMIFSEATSLDVLSDAIMDYKDDPFSPSYHFTPPTGSQSCGCGISFTK